MTRNDFSKAPSGGGARAEERDFKEVNALLLARSLAVCKHLVPGGHVSGDEYIAGSLEGGKGRSFSANLKTGLWADFATGQSGADLINLFAHVDGASNQRQARLQAEEWLGLEEVGRTQRSDARNPGPPASLAGERPVPDTEDDDDRDDWVKGRRASKIWNYVGAAGEPYADVYRYDHEDGKRKTFRQWDPIRKTWGLAKDRGQSPLLYLPELLSRPDETVVFVEGEKCADAVRELGYLATTNLGGSTAVSKTDLSALKGRRVLLWPDNDEPGRKWAAALKEGLLEIRAVVQEIAIPASAGPKWDAGSVLEAERRSVIDQALKQRPLAPAMKDLEFLQFPLSMFMAEPKEKKWLVKNVFPAGELCVLSAQGDTGKGMMLLDLALNVAGGPGLSVVNQTAFGCTIARFGQVLILSAEDTFDEFSLRLHKLDPTKSRRERALGRLHIEPLPNMGGSFALVAKTAKGIERTKEFGVLRDALLSLPDLALVIVDPLSSFVEADLSTDSVVVKALYSGFGALGQETGATIIFAHHMRKTSGAMATITTAEQARAAVLGVTGIVDGVRAVYALWSVPKAEARKLLDGLGQPSKGDAWKGRVVHGSIVKANHSADRSVTTYLRDVESGLLKDQTMPLRIEAAEQFEPMKAALIAAVRNQTDNGHYFVKTGPNSPFKNQECLPRILRGVSQPDLWALTDRLLLTQDLVTCKDGKKTGILDYKDGPYARADAVDAQGERPTFPQEKDVW